MRLGDGVCHQCYEVLRPADERCPKCGTLTAAAERKAQAAVAGVRSLFCSQCGAALPQNAQFCGGCGAAVPRATPVPSVAYASPAREFSGALAFLCWFLLGGVGLHRFYLGQTTYGVVMLCVNVGLTLLTAGLWLPFALLWWVVELFLLPGALQSARARR